MLQIDSFDLGYRVFEGAADFYIELASPEDAIIFRDGIRVDSLDGFKNGPSSANAIYKIEL